MSNDGPQVLHIFDRINSFELEQLFYVLNVKPNFKIKTVFVMPKTDPENVPFHDFKNNIEQPGFLRSSHIHMLRRKVRCVGV